MTRSKAFVIAVGLALLPIVGWSVLHADVTKISEVIRHPTRSSVTIGCRASAVDDQLLWTHFLCTDNTGSLVVISQKPPREGAWVYIRGKADPSPIFCEDGCILCEALRDR